MCLSSVSGVSHVSFRCRKQSPKYIVGASALLTGKFLRVRKVFAHICKITHGM